MPDSVTSGGHRRYKKSNMETDKSVVAYARVSCHDQKEDLEKQKAVLSLCTPDVLLSDTGSGLNFNKPGFRKLLSLLLSGSIREIIITNKDRLLRFGYELMEKLCLHFQVKLTVLHEKQQKSFEEQLALDLITIITVFTSKLYGERSHKNKKCSKAG